MTGSVKTQRQSDITGRIGSSYEKILSVDRVHVIPIDSRWAVRSDSAGKAHKIYEDKLTAVKDARRIASRRNSPVLVHNSTGAVEAEIHPLDEAI